MDETRTERELRELEREMAREFGWTQWRGPYSALPTPTSIRLLEIVADPSDEPEQPIRCSFKIVDLNDLPVYSALSYTWGNPRGLLPPGEDIEADRVAMNVIYPIFCDGEIIEVTANCYSFIRHFQKLRKYVSYGSEILQEARISPEVALHIWIDAICINQDSIYERTCQVRIMDRVYRQATKVLIWLGPEDALTRAGCRALAQLFNFFEEIRHIPGERLSMMVGRLTDCPLFKKHGYPDISPDEWQGVLCLFRRTWFSRSWTVQEFALAGDPLFMCGVMVASWTLFHRSICFLGDTGWTTQLTALELSKDGVGFKMMLEDAGLADYCGPKKGLTVIHQSRELFHTAALRFGDIRAIQHAVTRHNSATSGIRFPLQRLLGVFCYSQSSLPQDRLYAYLGLLPEASWQGLTIDYVRPATDTFVQATWAMIKSTHSLSILSLVEDKSLRTPEFQGLPSWVPDFSAHRFAMYLDPGSKEAFAGRPSRAFDCTKGSSYDMEVTDNVSRTLSVVGYLHSVVSDVGKNAAARSSTRILKQSKSMLECVHRLPQDCFWKTLISDHDIWTTNFPASPQSARHIFLTLITPLVSMVETIVSMESSQTLSKEIEPAKRKLRKAFINYVILSGEYQNLGAGNGSRASRVLQASFDDIRQYVYSTFGTFYSIRNLEDTKEVVKLEADINRAYMSVDCHMAYRLLFTTRSGHIGKAPCSTRIGDEVWVLRGAKVPYILRPSAERGQYELVGEAYVYGIMQGEELDDMERNFREIQII